VLGAGLEGYDAMVGHCGVWALAPNAVAARRAAPTSTDFPSLTIPSAFDEYVQAIDFVTQRGVFNLPIRSRSRPSRAHRTPGTAAGFDRGDARESSAWCRNARADLRSSEMPRM
jgi:hypothetical protein